MRPAQIALLQRVAVRAMTMTYTRTPVTAGTVNTWNEQTSVPGTPVSGLPCLYSAEDQLISDAEGTRTVSVPTLYVPPDDPLAVGDLVSAVSDRNGAVLLAGPLTVETINPNAEAGASVLQTARLRGSDVRKGG
jgi:hypothetical protein